MLNGLRKRFKSWLLLDLMTNLDELDDQAKYYTFERIFHDMCERCGRCTNCELDYRRQWIDETGRKNIYVECKALPILYRRARKIYGMDKEDENAQD